MRRFVILTRSLFAISLRDKSALAWGFAFPIGLILLYGLIFGQDQQGGVSAMTWLVVGVVTLNIMAGGLMGEAGQLTETRERGLLQRVHATPLPALHLVGAHIVVRLTIMLLQSATLLAIAVLLFGAQISAGGLLLGFGLALAGALVFFALGQAIGSVAPTSKAAFAIGQAIYFPLMFVSNLFIPADTLPGWLTDITRFTPAYMLVDVLRPAFVPLVPQTQAIWIDLLGLALYGMLGLALTARFFGWEPRT